jgi:hypothetical protein
MPWKQGYTISDEISLSDKDLHWPDGNRCCVSISNCSTHPLLYNLLIWLGFPAAAIRRWIQAIKVKFVAKLGV